MEDKSPSVCRLCNITLASPNEWRQHAKSDWHVYNLRLKVAEPGATITPPSSASPSVRPSEREVDVGDLRAETAISAPLASQPPSASPRTTKAGDAQSSTPSDDDNDSDSELSEEPEFQPRHCLFCGAENSTFDINLAHMSKAHSFSIPYQDHLAVDLETLVGYLYLVIYGCGECILCATRCNTVKGIQQHMTAKGHCRFEVASDIADFYELPDKAEYHADEESLRLPSGKVLGHRTGTAGPSASKTARPSVRLTSGKLLGHRKRANGAARQAAERRSEHTASTSETPAHAHGAELVPAQDDAPTPAACTQLSRLTLGDQQSLAHLPESEVRSLLARNARNIDQARREETDAQLRLEKAGNTTLQGHFRRDTSKRFWGPWG